MGLWISTQLLVYATVCWYSFYCIMHDEYYFRDDFDSSGEANNRLILKIYLFRVTWIHNELVLSMLDNVYLFRTWHQLGTRSVLIKLINFARISGFSTHNPSNYYSTTSYFVILVYAILTVLSQNYLNNFNFI